MPIVAPSAPVIQVSYNQVVIPRITAGLDPASGIKHADFTFLMAALNPDNTTYAVPAVPVQLDGQVPNMLPLVEQLTGEVENAAADATAAATAATSALANQISAQAMAAYAVANPQPGFADPDNPTPDETAALQAWQTAQQAAASAAITAAAQQISDAGTAAAAAVTTNATNAGNFLQALQAFDAATQAVGAAYINYFKPAGFPTVEVQ